MQTSHIPLRQSLQNRREVCGTLGSTPSFTTCAPPTVHSPSAGGNGSTARQSFKTRQRTSPPLVRLAAGLTSLPPPIPDHPPSRQTLPPLTRDACRARSPGSSYLVTRSQAGISSGPRRYNSARVTAAAKEKEGGRDEMKSVVYIYIYIYMYNV